MKLENNDRDNRDNDFRFFLRFLWRAFSQTVALDQKRRWQKRGLKTALLATALFLALNSAFFAGTVSAKTTLLNASYDPTREFYAEVNAAFAKEWQSDKNDEIVINQSHVGSGKQARSVIDGLAADVVTLALSHDIDSIAENSPLLPKDWQTRLPYDSAPYTSTIVFLVRGGNPKGIKGWDDLVKPGISVITPNPKTSGGARWNYLAAWGYALKANGGDEAKAEEFVARLFKNVPVLDTGARGSTVTFTQRGIGDVLVTWENEAFLAVNEIGKDKIEIVVPSASILAEPPVALVDKNVDKHGTRAAAEAYLQFLYTQSGQELAAKHYFRPRLESAAAKFAARFSKLELFTIGLFGGWPSAQKRHFTDGGVFDRIYNP